jgi:hypothetical protein
VPCLERKPVQNFILQEAKRLGLSVVCKQVIENKVFGVRVWRNED